MAAIRSRRSRARSVRSSRVRGSPRRWVWIRRRPRNRPVAARPRPRSGTTSFEASPTKTWVSVPRRSISTPTWRCSSADSSASAVASSGDTTSVGATRRRYRRSRAASWLGLRPARLPVTSADMPADYTAGLGIVAARTVEVDGVERGGVRRRGVYSRGAEVPRARRACRSRRRGGADRAARAPRPRGRHHRVGHRGHPAAARGAASRRGRRPQPARPRWHRLPRRHGRGRARRPAGAPGRRAVGRARARATPGPTRRRSCGSWPGPVSAPT
jgi:hypothetical protein